MHIKLFFNSYIFIKKNLLKTARALLLFRGAPKNFEPDMVLVLKIGGLGDFIFGIPALNLLRQLFPNSKILLITAKSLSKLNWSYSGRDPLDTTELPWVDLVSKTVDGVLVVQDMSPTTIKNIAKLIPAANKTGVFLLGYPGITASSVIKKMLFSRFIVRGMPVCLGINKELDYGFMRKFQSNNNMCRHKMMGDIDSVMEAKPGRIFNEIDLDFRVSISSESVQKVMQYVEVADRRKLILVAPLATTQHKQWPLENFVNLINEIKTVQEKSEFILVGTREQYAQAEMIRFGVDTNLKNLCGKISVHELASLFSVAQGYIGNDGGMSQLAGLLGCPSVIAFNSVEEDGITHPWRSSGGVVRNRTDCSPCYDSLSCPKGHNKCMTGISVASMVSAVHQTILKKQAEPLKIRRQID